MKNAVAVGEDSSLKSSTSSFESIHWSSDDTSKLVTRAKVVRYRTLERYNTQLKKFKENNQLFSRILVIKLVKKEYATDFENRCAAIPWGKEISLIPSVTYSYPVLNKGHTDVHFPPTLFYPDFLHVLSSSPVLPSIEDYTVVLTTEKGERTYAFCTRYNKKSREEYFYPEVFVIVSPVPAPSFYYTLSRSLVDVALKDAVDCNKLFSSVHILKYPFKQHVASEDQLVMGIRLDQKYKPFQTIMSPFLSKIGVNATLFLFLAVLAERRIIITGSSIADISQAVQVLVKLIQPLQWPHTLIPVVPDSQVDLCHNPTPFICGLLRHNLNHLKEILVTEIPISEDLIDPIIFDVDQGVVLPSPLWSKKSVVILCKSMGYPDTLVKALFEKFQKLLAKKATPQEIDAKITEKVTKWYAKQFGHFCHFGRTALSPRSRRIMIASHPQKSSQAFLQWFLESGIYQAFVHLKVDLDLERQMMEHFEKQCKKYAPKISSSALKERAVS